MADTCPTVKVQPWGKNQGDFVEINEEDFDEKIHKKLSDTDVAKAATKAAKAAKGEAEAE